MSAIDTTFHWGKNPTAINGLATTYCSKRGSDVSGDGTAQNPYASKAKATSVATAGTNMMLDDAIWSEQRTLNNRAFKWWGNGKCELDGSTVTFTNYGGDYFYNFSRITNYGVFYGKFFDCTMIGNGNWFVGEATHCILYRLLEGGGIGYAMPENCICINTSTGSSGLVVQQKKPVNNIFIGTAMLPHSGECDYNNYTTGSIPTNNGGNAHSVNNASTGQTLADYFNYIHPNCLANPTTASVDEWLQCDFTAKPGSANIGLGKNGTTIGFNQGFTMYADNSANSVFKASNGATLKNIDWDSTFNGYTLVQKERLCQGATANTITLDSSASAEDDYYNNLFIGIVVGDGYGELFLITDYDGATKKATIDGTWTSIPNINSIYTISGTILSAVKDLGKAIKVKRNWTFADNFTALQDGQWAEFMTHVGTNGKQFPTSCYSYEYSTDGVNFIQGQTADDLVSTINGENKVTDNIYGDCSQNYDEAAAKEFGYAVCKSSSSYRFQYRRIVMAQYTFDTLKDFELAGISLPSGYQRVEWLQSTGTQYIKIPCQLNAINSISTKYKSAIGWTFGNCAFGSGSQGLMLNQQATTAVSWFGNRQYQDNLPYNSTNSYTKIVAGDDVANVSSSLNAIGIFCNLYQNNVSNRTSSTYYYFITNLFSLVACRRTSDSVAGMYDIVNDVFYENAGTGTFSVGGDVAQITPITGDTATITDLGITLTSDGTDWYVTNNITIPTLSQATQLFSFAKGDNGVTATITDLGITLTSDGTDWYVTNNITIPTLSQATQLFSFAKGDNGVTATITDLGITLTSDGTDWYVTNNITIPTLSQATQLFSFAKGDNGVTATITDLGITLTSDGTDWYVTSDITLATLSQATQLFAFAKGDNGVTVTVTSTGGVYKYEGDDWQIWYTIIPPLVFRGITFEQTDFWQIPEMVFRGFSFEGENILRYYGVKIDVNGETERNYIPCIRTSDGIAGMYDTVNGVFYASVGTNNFTT